MQPAGIRNGRPTDRPRGEGSGVQSTSKTYLDSKSAPCKPPQGAISRAIRAKSPTFKGSARATIRKPPPARPRRTVPAKGEGLRAFRQGRKGAAWLRPQSPGRQVCPGMRPAPLPQRPTTPALAAACATSRRTPRARRRRRSPSEGDHPGPAGRLSPKPSAPRSCGSVPLEPPLGRGGERYIKVVYFVLFF